MKYLLMLLLAAMSLPATASQWWDDSIWQDPGRKFLWYPPPHPPKPKQKKEAKSQPAKPQIPTLAELPDITSISELRRAVHLMRDRAVMNPTPENVRIYLAAQAFVLQKSSIFADVARRVVWATPSLDATRAHPVDAAAILTWDNLQQDKQRQALQAAMKNYGVYFIIRSDCPYCHVEAGTIQWLQQVYGVDVLTISLDDKGIPGFPHPLPDNGIGRYLAKAYGLESLPTPSLFLVPKHKGMGEPIAIAFGAISGQDLLSRLYTLTQTQPGQSF